MNTDPDLLALTRQYLAALEAGDPEGNLAFFAPDVVQEEFPNRLVPNGATRNMDQLREAALRGSKAVSGQQYRLLNAFASGNQVLAEVQWSATINVPFGTLAPGDTMRARFAIVLEFRDGKIVRQRNYDCFDPF
jgi:ketosteroid isomerase-like protein